MAGWEVCVACSTARVDAPELCRDGRPHRLARYIFHPVQPPEPEDEPIEWVEPAPAPAAPARDDSGITPVLPTAVPLDLTPSAAIPLHLAPSDPLEQDPLSLAPFEVPYDPLSSISAPAVLPAPDLNVEPLDELPPLDVVPLEMVAPEPGAQLLAPLEPISRPVPTPHEGMVLTEAQETETPTLLDPPPPRPVAPPSTPAKGGLAAHEKGPGGIPFDATFLARYRPLGVLGKGGAGIVYRVIECSTGREAALKFLVHLEKTAVARFQAECQTLSKLNHPRVLAVMGTGQWKSFPYLLTEVVEGETLKDRLLAEGTLSVRSALQYTVQILEGLEYLHAQGVVHRDLKPANIFLTEAGGLRIGDFGVARTPWRQNALTEPGTVVGTPRYMSPEQATGDPITFASDIYSLGVVLFELLTGRAPFIAPSLAALLSAHVRKKHPALRSIKSDLPDELEPALARALEKKPGKRYASAAEFARALQGLLDRSVDSLVPTGPAPALAGSDAAMQRPGGPPPAEGSVEVAVLPAVVRDPSGDGPLDPKPNAPGATKPISGARPAHDPVLSGFGSAVTHPPAEPPIKPPRKTVERPIIAAPPRDKLPAPRETHDGNLPAKPMDLLLANLPWVAVGAITVVLVLMALAGAH